MIDAYRRLFVHRSDVFAEQHESGAYFPVKRPLEDHDIAAHLRGEVSYGVYVIDPQPPLPAFDGTAERSYVPNTVSYVVFDLDTYDADALGFLTRAVERLVAPESPAAQGRERLRCLLLEDSGGKGYHIWLLLSAPIAASKVRAWTETIRAQYQTAMRTVVDKPWPALEIFPKQDSVEAGGYGNLVKLPLGRHARSKATSFFVPRGGWASGVEGVVPFPVELIPEPRPAPRRHEGSVSGTAPFACISQILEDGAGTGQRDTALYHFARYARSCGLPVELAQEWCELVNDNFDPPMTAREVRTKVASAYRANASNPGCSAEWLRDYCPGGPHCFAPWNSEYRTQRNLRGISSESEEPWLSPEERRRRREEGE